MAQVSLGSICIFCLAMLFPAVDSILKETLFRESQAELQGQHLDLFVVNSFGSLAQALCILALLPAFCCLQGLPLRQLPAYAVQGRWQREPTEK